MHFLLFLFNFFTHLNENLAIFATHYHVLIYIVLFLIVFSETGLIVAAFVMAGDSLLFATGTVASTGILNLYLLITLLITAAFLGNIVNYLIGKVFGNWLLSQRKITLFKKSHFDKAYDFYEKHGGKTVIIARFMPVIRTFAPFVAGIAKMHNTKFTVYSFLGALFWVLLLLLSGYWFGNIPVVRDHFPLAILGIVLISLLPIIVEYVKSYKNIRQ